MEKLKTMVVDDEHFVREHFERRIPWEDAGFIWLGAAQNGREAIEMMERELPHIVLTDITMPVMDGLEFAKYVRDRWPKVKVIFLTAHDEFAYAQKALVLGAKNYLLKMGLSKEEILQACTQVAEEIKQERDQEEHIHFLKAEYSEKEWSARRQLVQRLLEGSAAGSELLRHLNGAIALNGRYYAFLSFGWDGYSVSAEQACEAHTLEETLDQRQKQTGQAIEQWEGMSGEPDIQAAVFPYKRCQLFIMLTCPVHRGYAFFQCKLNEFVHNRLSLFKQRLGTDCFVYVGPITTEPEQFSKLVREALARIQEHFYTGLSVMSGPDTGSFYEPGKVGRLEIIAELTRSLHARNWQTFAEHVQQLTQLRNPPYSPNFLLGVAEAVLDTVMEGSEADMHDLKLQLELIVSWEQYGWWWQQVKERLAVIYGLQGENRKVRREIQAICQMVSEQYGKNWSMADLAKAVNLNPAYVGQLFKQETGEYLTDYISRVRLHKAKELLERTDMKIYEVAQTVGITDYRYFCKMFKNMVGVTPTEYKKSI